MDHAQTGFRDPVMLDQGLFQHGQGDAFFFEFDDAVQPPQQLKTPVGFKAGRISRVFHMACGQVGRGDDQGAVFALAQLHIGKGLPQVLPLTPGDAAGFRAAEDLGRPLAQAFVQGLCCLLRQGAP